MAEKWIAGAIKKPGALHEALHVPEGEKIPAKKLAAKSSDSALMAKRKSLAKTLGSFKHEGKGGPMGGMPPMPPAMPPQGAAPVAPPVMPPMAMPPAGPMPQLSKNHAGKHKKAPAPQMHMGVGGKKHYGGKGGPGHEQC